MEVESKNSNGNICNQLLNDKPIDSINQLDITSDTAK